MTVNLTNVTNLVDWMTVIEITSSESKGILGVSILLAIFGVSFFVLKSMGSEPVDSFLGAFFMSGFLSFFLWIFKILPNIAFLIMALGTSILIIWTLFTRR